MHGLIDVLRKRGVTIFLTTHRLEEAERLCDRLAILNTTLRTIGRPDELRDQQFAKTLSVRTLAPLPDPGRVFAGLAAVDGWHVDGPAGYVLSVSEPAVVLGIPAIVPALVAAYAVVGERQQGTLEPALTPLIAAWSIWVGIAISARSNDIRVAQQLGMLASLPTVVVTSLIAFNAIHASLGLALGAAAALLLLDGLGWRITSATFDRERLIVGTR